MGDDFGDKIASLCSREFIAASRAHDGDRIATMIERLTHCLAFTVVNMAAGDAKATQTLLTGVEAHLYEATAAMPVFVDLEGAR